VLAFPLRIVIITTVTAVGICILPHPLLHGSLVGFVVLFCVVVADASGARRQCRLCWCAVHSAVLVTRQSPSAAAYCELYQMFRVREMDAIPTAPMWTRRHPLRPETPPRRGGSAPCAGPSHVSSAPPGMWCRSIAPSDSFRNACGRAGYRRRCTSE